MSTPGTEPRAVSIATMTDARAEQVLAIYAVGIATGHATFETEPPTWEALVTSTERAGIWTIQSGVFPENKSQPPRMPPADFRVAGTRQRIGRHRGAWHDVVLIERRSPNVT